MSADVDRWFKANHPPLADVMQRVRKIIVGAGVEEYVKHGSVSFVSNGGDMAAFVQAGDAHRVSLMFLRGGKLTGKYPSLEGATVKYLRFVTAADVDKAANELKSICGEWIALMTTFSPSPTPKKSTTKKSATKKRRAKR